MEINYAAMSDYLESILDSDLPVLTVGPGVTPPENIIPMDLAILWFAEKQREGNGTVDVLDLPVGYRMGVNDIDAVERYLHSFSERAKVSEFRIIRGDIATLELPLEMYGLIWDHATTSFSDAVPGMMVGPPDQNRVKQILTNYSGALCKGGKALVVGLNANYQHIELPSDIKSRMVFVGEDIYRTRLTAEQVFGELPKVDQYFRDGFLLPHHHERVIFELTRTD
tara:strand:- start:5 stop:679 length:675 start_codon:yes stop_codon:yes gene_type:complete